MDASEGFQSAGAVVMLGSCGRGCNSLRPPSRQMRQSSRWISLPVELLLRVLALLDGQELMTVRLVCRDWRQASLSYMTHLDLNVWLERTGLGGSDLACNALASCLQSLPSISHLVYEIRAPNQASLLNVPSCSDALKVIGVNFCFWEWHHIPNVWRISPAAFMLLEMAPLARLSGLTSFEAVASPRDSPFEDEALAVGIRDQFLVSSCQILKECRQLRKVVLYCDCHPEVWMVLVPLLAGLPHLTALSSVPLDNRDVMALVVQLTGLTCIHGFGTRSWVRDIQACLQPLLVLHALRAIDARICSGSTVLASIQPTRDFPQLAEFALSSDEEISPSELGSLLGPLSGLTKLELGFPTFCEVQHHLWQDCFTNLGHLAWGVPGESVGRTVELPSLLQFLCLEFDDPCCTGISTLVKSVAGLTNLTALYLSMMFPWLGWTSDGRANDSWRAATFLTGLTRLVDLRLDHILHVANVEVDVACLAALTSLRTLGLHASCSCHSLEPPDCLDEADPGYVPSGYEEGFDGWKLSPCGFEAFEDQGGFLPLLSLSGVKHIDLTGAWKVLMESPFKAAFNSVRQEMGRPPGKFGRRQGSFDIEGDP